MSCDTASFAVISQNNGSAEPGWKDNTVTPETEYLYRIKAINANGLRGPSNCAYASTPAAPEE